MWVALYSRVKVSIPKMSLLPMSSIKSLAGMYNGLQMIF